MRETNFKMKRIKAISNHAMFICFLTAVSGIIEGYGFYATLGWFTCVSAFGTISLLTDV